MKPEDLLTHADFVRSLARRLVADENVSADITQQTWIAAMERPSTTIKSPRSWLASVVRNFARMTGRGEARRRRRENACAKPERIPSTADIVQREEIRRKVVDTVLNLDEPYRSAIILRFYEDLGPTEVAEMLGVPIETARSRIKRGLARMRQCLDKEFGDRGLWSVALLPLAGLKLAPSQAALSAATAGATATASQGVAAKTALYGGMVMATKTKIGIVTLLVAVATITLWQVLPKACETNFIDTVVEDARFANRHGDKAVLQTEVADAAEVENQTSVALVPDGTPFSGRVVERETGEPVKRYEIKLERREVSMGDRVHHKEISEVFQNPEGRFNLRLEQGGTFSLLVYSTCHSVKVVRDLEIPNGDGLTDYEVELDIGHVLSGSVLDDATGDPVVGAVVAAARLQSSGMAWLLRGREDRFNHAITDEQGIFTLQGFSISGVFGNPQVSVAAVHPEFAEGWELIEPGVTDWVEIRLKKGLCVFGKVLNDDSEPIEGMIVQVRADNLPLQIHCLTDSDGRYRTTPISPGFIEVQPRIFYGQDKEAFNFSPETHQARIVDKDVEVDFGPSEEHVVWRGTLYGPAGEPEPGWRLSVREQKPEQRNLAGVPGSLILSTTADENGLFEFLKLSTGTYKLSCSPEGSFKPDHEEIVVLNKAGALEKDIKIPISADGSETGDDHTAAISGRVILESTDAPPRSDQRVRVTAARGYPRNFFQAECDGSGGFQVTGLAGGTYDLRVGVDGLPTKEVRGIRLKKGQLIDDINVTIPEGGTLTVKLTGFGKTGPRRFRLFSRYGAKAGNHSSTTNLDATGEWEMTLVREVGRWTYRAEFEGLGYAEKQVDVVASRTTEIVFAPDDLVSWATDKDGNVVWSIAGSLTKSDGIPLEDYVLRLYPIRVGRMNPNQIFATVTTDAEGLFSILGVEPGYWRVSVYPPEKKKPVWDHPFFILEDGENPHRLSLTLPDGSAHGTLCNAFTRQPISAEWAECEIMIFVSENEYICRNVVRPENGSFFVTGIPEGKYRLGVRVPGFTVYDGESFYHNGIDDLDLGVIPLEPCGLVKVKVVDPDGNLISKCQFFCDGVSYFPRRNDVDSEGYWLLKGMPAESVRIEIKAADFRSWDQVVELNPAELIEMEVVLERHRKDQ